MSFHKMFSASFKDMFHRKEFFAVFTLLTSIFCLAAVLDLALFTGGKDVMQLDPAWSYWGSLGDFGSGALIHSVIFSKVSQMMVLVMPFLAPLAYSASYFDQARNGTLKVFLPRAGQRRYFLANMMVSFLGAFFIVLIPLLAGQAVFCAALPLHSAYGTVGYSAVFDESAADYVLFRSTYLNHPYLFNLIYSFIPAVAAGCFAMISFAFSLFYRKKRLFVLTVPGIAWLLLWFFYFSAAAIVNCPVFWLQPAGGVQFSIPGSRLALLFVVLFLIPLAAVAVKLHFKKDELL